MALLIQLTIFLIVFAYRGRRLLGWHLTPEGPNGLMSITRDKRNNITSMSIGYSHDGLLPLLVREEKWYHSLLKRFGISAELPVDDAAFDARYFVTSDFPHHTDMAAHSKKLVEAIKELFALNVVSLHATGDRIWCVIPTAELSKPMHHFTRHREILQRIANLSAEVRGDRKLAGRSLRNIIAMIAFLAAHAGLVAFGTLGILATYADSIRTLDWWQLIFTGIGLGLAGVVLWYALFRLFFGGTSWAGWVAVDFVLAGLAGMMLSGVVLAREANHWLGSGAATVMQQEVTDRSCTIRCRQGCGKRCSRTATFKPGDISACDSAAGRLAFMASAKSQSHICHSSAWFDLSVTVKDWRNPKKTLEFAPDEKQYEKTRIGEPVPIPVNPGALGIAWVDDDDFGKAPAEE